MADRQFRMVAIRRADSGPTQRGLRITCGGCGETCDVVDTSATVINHTALRRKYMQKGWHVGVTSSDDRCPACLAKRERLKVVPGIDDTKEQPMAEPTKTSPPSATADVKRRINQKLFDVYAGPGSGYVDGWGDNRVAEEIGVPRALVAAIREEFHGPEGTSPDIRKLLSDVDAIADEAAKIERRAADVARDGKAMLDRVSELIKAAAAIKKVVGAA